MVPMSVLGQCPRGDPQFWSTPAPTRPTRNRALRVLQPGLVPIEKTAWSYNPREAEETVTLLRCGLPEGQRAHLMLLAPGVFTQAPLQTRLGARDMAARGSGSCPQISHSLVRETGATVTIQSGKG